MSQGLLKEHPELLTTETLLQRPWGNYSTAVIHISAKLVHRKLHFQLRPSYSAITVCLSLSNLNRSLFLIILEAKNYKTLIRSPCYFIICKRHHIKKSRVENGKPESQTQDSVRNPFFLETNDSLDKSMNQLRQS